MRAARTVLMAIAASASLGTAPAIHAQPGKAEVMAVIQRLFDGMRAGDSTMVRSVFHPQVRMLTSAMRGGKPILSIEQGADNFAKAVGTPHAELWDERISNERVAIDGPLASVWVDYTFHRGTTFSHCGIDHFLLARGEDGAWRIVELADTRRQEGCGVRG